jgi:hypothetical protein
VEQAESYEAETGYQTIGTTVLSFTWFVVRFRSSQFARPRLSPSPKIPFKNRGLSGSAISILCPKQGRSWLLS